MISTILGLNRIWIVLTIQGIKKEMKMKKMFIWKKNATTQTNKHINENPRIYDEEARVNYEYDSDDTISVLNEVILKRIILF